MVDSALKSWWSIFSDPNKIFIIRTHPEELHVLKYISSLHICTDFSQQCGQQMLTKCYPTSQGCSYDFQRLKVWPLGVPKPYRTSSYDALSPLSRSTLFCDCVWSHKFSTKSSKSQKVLTSTEAIRHCMRMFDTVLERLKVILLVFESHRNIPVMLGNTWPTSVDLIVD